MTAFSKEPVVTMGIDLAKNSMHVYGVEARGHKVLSKTVSRGKLSAFMANRPPCLVAMEACGSAHHWARALRDFGYEVRLIAPPFVKPFVKSGPCHGRRFIPASAGNTIWRMCRLGFMSVHPRERGEHVGVMVELSGFVGSSPRARGTRDEYRRVEQRPRFIPASAGNTCSLCRTPFSRSVHPRERGEHPVPITLLATSCGSSPRARGTRIFQAAGIS